MSVASTGAWADEEGGREVVAENGGATEPGQHNCHVSRCLGQLCSILESVTNVGNINHGTGLEAIAAEDLEVVAE